MHPPNKTKSPAHSPLLLVNISQLLTLRLPSGKPGPRRASELRELGIIKDGAVLCGDGKIVSVSKTDDLLRDPCVQNNRKSIVEIDCAGQVVLPGFVDSHTHPVFVGPRLADFEKRIEGASYEQIAEAGGGICSSVNAVRKANKESLAERVLTFLCEFSEQGTTTVETKSGYGLTVESEMKSLEAIHEAAGQWRGTTVSTLLGAHVVPQEFKNRAQEYVDLVCREMIPRVAKRRLARFADVFVERGAFSSDDAIKIFDAAATAGLGTRAHVCQLSHTNLQPLLRYNAASFDHLDYVSDDDIALMAKHDTMSTLVPGANYFLGAEKFPPARQLIDAGVPVALATDYNPGSSPTVSMPFVLSLACTRMKMSPAEAIAAATLNGAWALRLQQRKGTIEPGKDADLAVFDVADYREIAYWFAWNRCAFTVLSGSTASVESTSEAG